MGAEEIAYKAMYSKSLVDIACEASTYDSRII